MKNQYIFAAAFILIGMIIVKIINTVLIKRFNKIITTKNIVTSQQSLTAIESPLSLLLYVLVIYFGLNNIELAPKVKTIIHGAVIFFGVIFAVRVVLGIIGYGLEQYWQKRNGGANSVQTLSGIKTVLTFLVWVLGLVFFLDNMGVKISALVAGLGIGGIAVALAAQALLGDLFSFFAIFFDRPFEIGDFIILDNYLGTVEHIGIKTTRIRSLSGEQLVLSNTDLTSSRIRNYKRMERRRVVFSLGVTYDTSVEKLKKIPELLKTIIKSLDKTEFDRAHFSSYGDFSLNFEIVYFVLDSDYNVYMDINQAINFRVKEEFEKLGVDFAFPTQTLYMNKDN